MYENVGHDIPSTYNTENPVEREEERARNRRATKMALINMKRFSTEEGNQNNHNGMNVEETKQ